VPPGLRIDKEGFDSRVYSRTHEDRTEYILHLLISSRVPTHSDFRWKTLYRRRRDVGAEERIEGEMDLEFVVIVDLR
jgi:hypothetical protein